MFERAILQPVQRPIDGNQAFIDIASWGIGKAVSSLCIVVIKAIKSEFNIVAVVITPIKKGQSANSLNRINRVLHNLALFSTPSP